MTDRLHAAALWLLAPAPAVFAVHAALQLLADRSMPWWSQAAVGIAAGAGLIALVVAHWSGKDRWRAALAAAIALLGHWVVADHVDGDLGAAMVYLGVGFGASLRSRPTAYAGLVAATGALLRGSEAADFGLGLVAVGGAALSLLLVRAALRPGVGIET